MVTKKSDCKPLNLPVSGGSLMYSMMSSRTRPQNCLGDIQTLPSTQSTFAECLLDTPTPSKALYGNLLAEQAAVYLNVQRLQDHIRILFIAD